jgi:hypothetical protein
MKRRRCVRSRERKKGTVRNRRIETKLGGKNVRGNKKKDENEKKEDKE